MILSKEELKKKFGEKEYAVEFFKEYGFIRKRCKICGGYFWTLNYERETCGDVECEGTYRFIEGQNWNTRWDIHNTIKKWTTFFEKRGHTVLDPYPVVARWRDDLEFTIASIVAFQPWVTEGIVDPPANPLVIPQPCLRFGGEFSDVDNIGKTGRHLTSFTMGGQHAFNSKKNWVYWKDEYVRYNFEFMTKVLGIKPEELTYKEDVWIGGGNFGPSLETFAYGLELVNGVFMQYKYSNGQITSLKLKVLDVGWGIERLSWFMQRTPTIYEATFGPLFEWLVKHVGLSYDKKLLIEYARLSGGLDTKSPERFRHSRSKIAQALGLTLHELDSLLGSIESIYAILDHTKTLVFAIPDGALPSNVGGAYNLRVILRRAISLAENYGFDIDWYELLERQINYFAKSFPRLLEGKDVIRDVWKVEYERYRHTLNKGLAELSRIIKKKKLKKIGYEVLRDLYINFGLPPDSVVKAAEKLNIPVEIPSNFFDRVKLEKHVGEEVEREIELEEVIEKKLGSDLEKLPPTKPLFYEDQYLKEFDAHVVYVRENYIVLDQTAFYPRGGGQSDDTGWLLIGENDRIRVTNVRKIGNIIVHVLETSHPRIEKGAKVHGIIDWDRRIALMRHHTATHIINAAARYVLGSHVWQVGADKSVDRARLDISHYKNLTLEEIRKIEDLANKIVMENRPVHIEVLDRTTAEKKYGFRIYQGGSIPGRLLRIVSIKEWDSEACGGTHLKNTGEVGPIKIIGTKRIHDGVVRLMFVAGETALKYLWQEEDYLKSACNILRVEPKDLPKTVKRFFDEWKDQQSLIRKLAQTIIDNIEIFVKRKILKINDNEVSIIRLDIPHELMIEVLKRINKLDKPAIIASTVYGKTMIISNIRDEKIMDVISTVISNNGGKCKNISLGMLCTVNMDATTLLVKIEEELDKLTGSNR